jgi:hypothetical protein
MLNRYPDQSASRNGYTLIGAFFLLFGIAMAIFEATFISFITISLALALMLPSLFCGHSAFEKYERVLSHLFAGW